MRISDIRGAVQLAAQATSGVTRIVEGVHQSVWSSMGFPAGKTQGETRGITGQVYRAIHGITRVAGKGADSLLASLQALNEPAENDRPGTPRREAWLAALNGVVGNRLAENDNPFAIPMSLRYRDEALNWQSLPEMPDASGKVVLLIHGLCMNDLQQHARRNGHVAEHGATLAAALDYSPVYLRYNSGLHVSQNGHELSAQLEQLDRCWPEAIEDLSVVAHSMGGLLIRSALHYATQEGLSWPSRLGKIVFLGTPHHGAPLERIGNWLDIILATFSHTRPFTALGKIRSAGITDLRYGNVLHEDWQDRDRFHHKPHDPQHVPLPGAVDCYCVAATLATKRSALADHLIGDGMVPLRSALGEHGEKQRTLSFSKSSQWIAHGTNHMELLDSPEVIRQVERWLAPVDRVD